MIPLPLAPLGGTPARVDDLQVVAQVRLERPGTLPTRESIGPQESRAIWGRLMGLLTPLAWRRQA